MEEPKKERRTHQQWVDKIREIAQGFSKEMIYAYGISKLLPQGWQLTPERIRQILIRHRILEENNVKQKDQN